METLYEYWEYKFVKSKSKPIDIEIEAHAFFKDFPSPEFFANGTLVYAIDEKQMYRVKHTRKHKQAQEV